MEEKRKKTAKEKKKEDARFKEEQKQFEAAAEQKILDEEKAVKQKQESECREIIINGMKSQRHLEIGRQDINEELKNRGQEEIELEEHLYGKRQGQKPSFLKPKVDHSKKQNDWAEFFSL